MCVASRVMKGADVGDLEMSELSMLQWKTKTGSNNDRRRVANEKEPLIHSCIHLFLRQGVLRLG